MSYYYMNVFLESKHITNNQEVGFGESIYTCAMSALVVIFLMNGRADLLTIQSQPILKQIYLVLLYCVIGAYILSFSWIIGHKLDYSFGNKIKIIIIYLEFAILLLNLKHIGELEIFEQILYLLFFMNAFVIVYYMPRSIMTIKDNKVIINTDSKLSLCTEVMDDGDFINHLRICIDMGEIKSFSIFISKDNPGINDYIVSFLNSMEYNYVKRERTLDRYIFKKIYKEILDVPNWRICGNFWLNFLNSGGELSRKRRLLAVVTHRLKQRYGISVNSLGEALSKLQDIQQNVDYDTEEETLRLILCFAFDTKDALISWEGGDSQDDSSYVEVQEQAIPYLFNEYVIGMMDGRVLGSSATKSMNLTDLHI